MNEPKVVDYVADVLSECGAWADDSESIKRLCQHAAQLEQELQAAQAENLKLSESATVGVTALEQLVNLRAKLRGWADEQANMARALGKVIDTSGGAIAGHQIAILAHLTQSANEMRQAADGGKGEG